VAFSSPPLGSMASKIAIWACSASCADGRDRTVLALYRDGRCLLVQRPWVAPTTTRLLDQDLHNYLPFFGALVSAADYRLYKNVWYGEIAVDWRTIAALASISRGTIETQLKAMAHAGMIFYHPGHSWFRPPLIRIYPYQKKTGIHLIEPEASWTRGFVSGITPRTLEIEMEPRGARGREHAFHNRSASVPQARVCDLVSEAPIVVSDEGDTDPSRWGLCRISHILPGNADIIRTICRVPELEDMANMCCGVDPAVGFDRPDPVSPETMARERGKEVSNWRSSWTESGISVVVSDANPTPEPGQLGVAPSWALVADAPVSPQTLADGVCPGTATDDVPGPGSVSPQTSAAGVAPHTDNNQLTDSNNNQLINRDDKLKLLASDPNGWGLSPERTRASLAAPAAPAPGPVPSASKDFVKAPAKRQLTQEQLNGLYRQRGPRLNDLQRGSLTVREGSCVETYERWTGVPFCRDDKAGLDSALTLTSHELVLRGIRRASVWPDPPGYYVMKNGFAHVLSVIQNSKYLHIKYKKSKQKAKVTSALSDDVKEKPIDFRKHQPAPGPGDHVQAVAGPSEASASPSGAPAASGGPRSEGEPA